MFDWANAIEKWSVDYCKNEGSDYLWRCKLINYLKPKIEETQQLLNERLSNKISLELINKSYHKKISSNHIEWEKLTRRCPHDFRRIINMGSSWGDRSQCIVCEQHEPIKEEGKAL